MKKILIPLMLSLFFTAIVNAQSKAQQEVANAVEALRKAMVDGDKASLEGIAAEGLSYGHSSGKVENKASFVENIANGNSDFVTIDLTDQSISLFSKTAIVRHVFNTTTNDKGKAPGAVKLAILTVWQKDKKEWKMIARQAVKI